LKLEPGTTLLHYRLADKLGEGGMGVVWRAADTVLDRQVAIKVLPGAFTADPERLARFEREAKLLASLNHPGIAAIHGLHEAEGVRFLAMELVEGEDLAERLARGALTVDDALDVARQLAEALETAHESGIVHRDLKPANVKRTTGGKVKVLDFGLAKALEPAGSSGEGGDPSLSPTLTGAGTAVGMVLGTAAYMSPEQARGRPVDRRADIWAFGVVLFEMMTGTRLYEGETVSDTLAAVLTREPDWSALPTGTPLAVRGLLRRCLDRDPRKRLRDIGEARVLLESPGRDEAAPRAPAPRSGSRALALLLAAAGMLAAAGAAWVLKPTAEPPMRRLSLASPVSGETPRLDPRIAPDGRSMAYISAGKLWLQGLDQLTARPVTGGEGAGKVVWSPDGRALAFVVGPRVYRAPLGGDPVLVADLPVPIGDGGGGLCWTRDGRLVYSTGHNDLFEVAVTGGAPRSILAPVLGRETDFHEPSALPDGRGVLYVVHRSPQGLDTLEVLSGGERKVLYQEEGGVFGHPVYSPTGHVLFDRNDASTGIWALPFSLSELRATGEPVLVTAQGSRPSVSREGTLLYSNLVSGGGHQLVVVDRAGEVLETIGDRMQHVDNATLSPDRKRLAACVAEGKDDNLWLFDLVRRSRSVLVHDARCGTRRGQIAWAGDGSGLLFGSTETTTVRQRRTEGTGGETTLVEGLQPSSGLDGRFVVFVRESTETLADLWWMRTDGASAPEPLLATPAREDQPKLSPDGTLLAYVSDETGRYEVYLRDFPDGKATWQVSDAGGAFPRWSRTGDRLFFLQDEDLLIEAEIKTRPDLEILKLTRLFRSSLAGLGFDHGYDVFGAGERIVTVRYENTPASAGDLTLVTGWRGP